MVDRYDADSVKNVNKYEGATDASSDVWAGLVTHITGYPVPDRSTVFDTLRSDHGGKLFRMDIRDRSLGSFVKDASGFLRNTGEDYDIWFFDGGKKTQIKQARIVFEGRVRVGDETIFAEPGTDDVANASVREGNEFKDYNKDQMSTVALARYMNGPRTALLELLGGNTADARFSNLGVAEDASVDLNSFNTTGRAFDFAAQFFRDQGPKIKEWEDALGREDATWKGEAAEVFRSLLTKIRENYDAYIETFDEKPSTGEGDGTGKTVYSRALSQARSALEDAAGKLLDAWITWANSDYYDPHQVLRYVLDDLAQWVDTNNVDNTDIKTTYSAYSSTTYHDPRENFTQNHPEYGDLTDIANWAKVGDKAVQIWSRGVDEYLVKPARTVQSTLNNTFLDLGSDFTENLPEPKSTSTASQEYEKRKAEEAQEEINRQNEENRKYQDELREEQNRQREEDRKYQDELREEQN
ncbi:AAWKG family protein, partial [Streptomyces ardesiacus]